VVAVADGLPRNLLISHDDYEDRHDPHVWMNPNLWSRVVLEIRDALIEVHPDGAETLPRNADAYLDDLAALAQYTQKCWPPSRRKPGPACRRMTRSTISARPTGSK
jgi:manganese/zinc/iron transport system substrate-binding protein